MYHNIKSCGLFGVTIGPFERSAIVPLRQAACRAASRQGFQLPGYGIVGK
jgi:hypothetical protein